MKGVRWIAPAILLLALVPAAAEADGPLPAFLHFQGVLSDDAGAPVTGTLSMTFRLYEDTTQAAIWEEADGSVDVTNGFYEVDLDVGSLPFDVPYYLGIEVEGSALGPKKPLGSVPYCFRSAKTRVVAGEGLEGSSDSMVVELSLADSGVTSAKIRDGAVGGGKIATGEVVRSLNNLTEHVQLLAGNQITITEESDSTIRITAALSGEAADSDWEISGDDMYALPEGNVGIGTATPGMKLDVAGGSVRASGQLISEAPEGVAPLVVGSATLVAGLNAEFLDGHEVDDFAEAAHGHAGEEITSGTIAYERLPVGTGAGTVAAGDHTHPEGDGDWTISGSDLYWATGDVGIGTTSPEKTLDVEGDAIVSGGLYVGTDNSGNDDHLYFDSGTTEWVRWDDAQTRFELSDEVAIAGPIAVGTSSETAPIKPYNYFALSGDPSPTSDDMLSAGDLYVQIDMEIGSDLHVGDNIDIGYDLKVGAGESGDADAIYFDDGTTEKIEWDDAQGRFEVSDELVVAGPLAVGGLGVEQTPVPYSYVAESSFTPSGEDMNDGGDLYVQHDLQVGNNGMVLNDLLVADAAFIGNSLWVGPFSGSGGVDPIYFDSSAAEWFAWDDYREHFRLSDDLAMAGKLSVGPTAEDSTKPYNYIVGNGNWSPPSGGGIDSASDLYIESDLEAGGNIYVNGDLVDLSPGPRKIGSKNVERLSKERALAVLRALRPLLYREGEGARASERAGFDADSIPPLVAPSEAGGSRPLDVLAVLVRIVQEQQATIDTLEERVRSLERK